MVQLLPIQIPTQELRIVLLIRKTMKKKRPQIQSGLLTATSGCSATSASSATESSSFLRELYSHQDEDDQDLFLSLSEGEKIDDGSMYALRVWGQVGCGKDPYKHPALTAIIAMINPNQPPLSRICVNACEYAYMGANFL